MWVSPQQRDKAAVKGTFVEGIVAPLDTEHRLYVRGTDASDVVALCHKACMEMLRPIIEDARENGFEMWQLAPPALQVAVTTSDTSEPEVAEVPHFNARPP
ncbi:MAG TPA: hypothetical protein VHL34_14915 [Rhizomicrobium sp.]|jgi:hypothetical protein|nr:hypothetical protein [Rhizomicrobium sp.]